MIPVITKKAADDLRLGANGSYSNEGNVLQHTLYDEVIFQDATLRATTTFFTQPIGAAFGGGVKTRIETNLQDPGKLPNGQTMLIKEIAVALKPFIVGADTDMNTVIQAFTNINMASLFEIKIAGREFDLQTPGSNFFPPVFVTSIMSAANGQRVGEHISSGWIKLGVTPIPIGQLVSFNVTQSSGSAVAALATILDTASDVLNTQNASEQVRVRGILTRSI